MKIAKTNTERWKKHLKGGEYSITESSMTKSVISMHKMMEHNIKQRTLLLLHTLFRTVTRTRYNHNSIYMILKILFKHQVLSEW